MRLALIRNALLALLLALGVGGAAVAQDDMQQDDASPIALETVAEGMNSPVQLVSPPGDARRFVVDRAGVIYQLAEDGGRTDTPFLDLTDSLVELQDGFDERGLLGLAFHPRFAENGRFFVYYSAPLREEAPADWDHTAVVSEFKTMVPEEDGAPRGSSDQADPGTERVLLEIDQPNFNHDGGALDIGPDGHLYVALGDGGSADDQGLGHPPMGHGQDTTSILGNILRIDVDRGWPGYAVPTDNPFVGDPRGLDEIYSWGWRNPWRMSFDAAGNGDLYVATNGQNLWEAIYRIREPGNAGWNILEGTHCFDPEAPGATPAGTACEAVGPHGEPLKLPVIEYPHPGNQGDAPYAGISVVGGYMYRGDAIDALQGRYVFGDWSLNFGSPSGQLFVATPHASKAEAGTWPMERLMELESFVLGFGQDSEHELYVLTTQNTGPTGSTGAVHKIVPSEDDGS
jgi:glucose/arabinose dehydrogenase